MKERPPSLSRLIYRELASRRWSFLLAVLAIATAASLYFALEVGFEAQKKETRRTLLDLGRNLRIVHRETTPEELWLEGVPSRTLEEQAIDRLAAERGISYNRLLAKLERRIEVAGNVAILTGLSDERCPPGAPNRPIGFRIERRSAYLGHWIAQRLGATAGETIEVEGRTFRVERTLASEKLLRDESGSDQDLRIFVNLTDAQEILDLPGRVTEIEAIDCLLCNAPPGSDPVATLQAEIERVVPEARVILRRQIAEARAAERRNTERFAAFAIALLSVGSALWVAALAWYNARERRAEIGLLRALGRGTGTVLALVLGRAAAAGILGGATGLIVGAVLAEHFATALFPATGASVDWQRGPIFEVLIGAPLLSLLASFVPALRAALADPVEALRGE